MTISIITPSFRNSEWLKLCIASVADQGLAVEHIVQDAGSDDGTLDWLPSDKRVKTFVERDRGMYDGINRGLQKASGEILAYLNCDEQYLPGALKLVLQFFKEHPDIEVAFGHTVAVDVAGKYLWHRKVLVPTRAHTAVLPLSTLTCATFFRRSLIAKRKIGFDPAWRYCGDCVWILAMLDAGVPMAVIPQFTSVFTHTGSNLSLDAKAQEEARKFWAAAPAWNQQLRPLVLLHHRLRRWLGGIYSQRPFDFSLFTHESPHARVSRHVQRPTFRWRW